MVFVPQELILEWISTCERNNTEVLSNTCLNIKNTNINLYIFVCVCEHLITESCNCCCNKLQTLFYMRFLFPT